VKLKPHALDQWLQRHGGPLIEFDFGSSSGPLWRLEELLSLDGVDALDRLLDTELVYSRAAGGTALRQAIADMQGVPPEHVLVLAGASEALWHVFMAAAEPGANVLAPFPYFAPHRTIPEAFGFEVKSYHLRRENAYRIDLDEVRKLVDRRTKILMVNLPHNPTGAAISDAEMQALHDLCVECGIQFVCDEVHHPIYHGQVTRSAARLPRATCVGDFSKALSLSGLRLGWLIDADARRRTTYLNAREYITISNSPMAEVVGEIAIKHREVLWNRTREVCHRNLQLLDQFFATNADSVNWIRPQGGMTGFPCLTQGMDARAFCRAAVQRGVMLAPGDCFGSPEHFRIGFGMSGTWVPRALERLSDMLTMWHRTRSGA
jgi:aspartate/methionine/tyrosine aminotransferase